MIPDALFFLSRGHLVFSMFDREFFLLVSQYLKYVLELLLWVRQSRAAFTQACVPPAATSTKLGGRKSSASRARNQYS